MLGAYPVARNQELEVTLEGYLVLTADVPMGWLSMAIKRLMLHPDTTFAPSVGKIRQAAAVEITRSKRRAEGKDPDRGENGRPTSCPAEHIDARIEWARGIVGLPQIPAASSAVYLPPELEAQLARIGEGEG